MAPSARTNALHLLFLHVSSIAFVLAPLNQVRVESCLVEPKLA